MIRRLTLHTLLTRVGTTLAALALFLLVTLPQGYMFQPLPSGSGVRIVLCTGSGPLLVDYGKAPQREAAGKSHKSEGSATSSSCLYVTLGAALQPQHFAVSLFCLGTSVAHLLLQPHFPPAGLTGWLPPATGPPLLP